MGLVAFVMIYLTQFLECFFYPTYVNTFQDSVKAYYFPEKANKGSRGKSGLQVTKPLQFGFKVAWYFSSKQ